jgi:hypothetical protein
MGRKRGKEEKRGLKKERERERERGERVRGDLL